MSRLKRRAMNGTEVRVVGMSRSGNHAILQWMIHQMRGRVAFLNCVEPKTNPFESARPLSDGRRSVATWDGFDLAREAAGSVTEKDWLVYNYEDTFLGKVVSSEFEERRCDWLGASDRRVDVLVIRDPFNLLASRRRAGFYRGSDRAPPGMVSEAVAVRIWKQHAREALGERSHLGRGDARRVVIRYNDWAKRPEYRQRIRQELRLDREDDRTAGLVPRTAGGSSFDGTEANGAAHRMRVTERWRHYADDPSYRELLDQDVLELSEALFGPLPGTPDLLDDRRAA